jgi:hypothetical protein
MASFLTVGEGFIFSAQGRQYNGLEENSWKDEDHETNAEFSGVQPGKRAGEGEGSD